MATSTTGSGQHQSLMKIPGQVGYLILSEDGAVIMSHGELQNDERVARILFRLANLSTGYTPSSTTAHDSPGGTRQPIEAVKRVTVNFRNHFYAICSSNRRIVIVKRRYPQPHITAGGTGEMLSGSLS